VKITKQHTQALTKRKAHSESKICRWNMCKKCPMPKDYNITNTPLKTF